MTDHPFLTRIAATAMTPASGKRAAASASVFSTAMERAALAEMKAGAAIPERARPAVPDAVAPGIAPSVARGAFALFTPREMVPGSTERQRDAGYMGRKAIRREDVFDRMEDHARRAHARARGRPEGFVPPFDAGQVAIARHYRDLVERHEAGGMRCASLETLRGTSGSASGEFIDAFVHEGRAIARLRGAVGKGAVLVRQRKRKGDRALAAKGEITALALVDHVCLRDRTPSEVLEAYGFAQDAAKREALRAALGEALTRMRDHG